MTTEKRLIDANALFETLDTTPWYDNADRDEIALPLVDDAPTVDAVEVVRCKDCKYFVQGELYDPCECMRWIAKFAVAYTEPDGYCHKGGRKADE